MIENWNSVNIISEFSENGTSFYSINSNTLTNHYYIISSEESRSLMNRPEVVGYGVYTSLLGPSCRALNCLNKNDKIHSVSILNILRGALNFPIEEACNLNNIAVGDISFLSCERTFDSNGDINGLAVKYEKIAAINDATLMIGDIIASGETLVECLRHVTDYYQQNNTSLKKIVIFTIGGTHAIPLLENLTKEIRGYWPDFEGFITIFYEGIFSCYEPGDNGISGINRPLIDFIWRDGIISPEFRRQILAQQNALFEKCIIYDGGARRFNIAEHVDEVLEFWNGILKRANKINMQDLLEEKLGHKLPASYEDWLTSCHYNKLSEDETRTLYQQELDFIESLKGVTLEQIAKQRIEEFTSSLKKKIFIP